MMRRRKSTASFHLTLPLNLSWNFPEIVIAVAECYRTFFSIAQNSVVLSYHHFTSKYEECGSILKFSVYRIIQLILLHSTHNWLAKLLLRREKSDMCILSRYCDNKICMLFSVTFKNQGRFCMITHWIELYFLCKIPRSHVSLYL